MEASTRTAGENPSARDFPPRPAREVLAQAPCRKSDSCPGRFVEFVDAWDRYNLSLHPPAGYGMLNLAIYAGTPWVPRGIYRGI